MKRGAQSPCTNTHTYRRRHSERQPRRPSFLLCRCLAPLLEFIIHFRWYPLISCATRHWPIDGVSLITFRPCHLLVLSHPTLFSSSPIAPPPPFSFLFSPFLSLLLSVFSFCLSAAHWRQLICASLCLSLLINAPGSCCCCFFSPCFLFFFFYFLFLLSSLLWRTFLRLCIACPI